VARHHERLGDNPRQPDLARRVHPSGKPATKFRFENLAGEVARQGVDNDTPDTPHPSSGQRSGGRNDGYGRRFSLPFDSWITNSVVAAFVVVLARTGPRVSTFIVPTDTPGVSIGTADRKLETRARSPQM